MKQTKKAKYYRRYRAANRDKINSNRRNSGYDVRYCQTKKAPLIAWVNSLKNKPCLDCGNLYLPIAMDFDHVRGRKKSSISMAIVLKWAKAEIQKEIDKCDLVCSNCHRVRTWKRRQGIDIQNII